MGVNLAYTLSPYMLWDMGTDIRCEALEGSDLLGVYIFTKSRKYTGKESSWSDLNT